MAAPILATKLYIPPLRPNVVSRSRLIERLNEGLYRKLTLISAPAGFGKTTLLSEWLWRKDERSPHPSQSSLFNEGPQTLTPPPSSFLLHPSKVAWLSLDQGDNDPIRFLTYLIAALQTVAANTGEGVLGLLQSPQPPPPEAIMTTLLNQITALAGDFVLVLDDYHLIESVHVDKSLSFMLEHLPPQMHLVIATREDPQLPLARLRVRGQLTELRVADLRFTPSEAASFLNQVMGLNLATEDIAALETRTEGWIAGLQLAALSMQGYKDATGFIQSFTGSHHYVLDYLVEEVLQHQPPSVQNFLLRTSILGRLCGSLCDAVMLDATAGGQATLEYLEHANLFIVSLDEERRWYRYHHLFADLLRQRLQQSVVSSTDDASRSIAELHIRASQWFEDNGLEMEAFQHAAAANDIERAERLIAGEGMPLHFRGAVTLILDWLASLPPAVMNARPVLWWRYASLMLINGQTTGVEEKLEAAETALQSIEAPDQTEYLTGRIATARATLALSRYQVETMIVQSLRALEFLPPATLSLRANANWTLAYAYFLQGDRAASRRAIMEAISLCQAAKAIFTGILATISLGNLQEADNQLYQAAETYRRVMQLAGTQPLQIFNEAHLGLARIFYEWNDLAAAEEHAQKSHLLAQQYDRVIDRFIMCEVFLARLKLAQGQVAEAAAILARANQSARQHNFVLRLPEVAAAQVLTWLRQGHLAAAAQLAQAHDLPLSQTRVHLAQGNPAAALAILEPLRRQMEARDWQDERLKVMVLQALAFYAHSEKARAVEVLSEALALAEPEGFIRIFIDEGLPMAQLLSEIRAQGIMPDYTGKLLALFEAEKPPHQAKSYLPGTSQTPPLIEPLSGRELEILQLIAQGLSNQEIGEKLFLALDTVKGHNQKIFGKLQVQRRTEAVARARELGLL